MLGQLVGASIGYDLIKKKKFKPIIVLNIIFIILGLFIMMYAINYMNTKNRLKKENIIVTATIYPYTRESMSGDKYDGLYYEWKYNEKYYSSKIPFYDGFAEKSGAGTVYDIYIDRENPNIFARVKDESNPLAGGIIITGLFSLNLIIILIYKRKTTVVSVNNNKNL